MTKIKSTVVIHTPILAHTLNPSPLYVQLKLHNSLIYLKGSFPCSCFEADESTSQIFNPFFNASFNIIFHCTHFLPSHLLPSGVSLQISLRTCITPVFNVFHVSAYINSLFLIHLILFDPLNRANFYRRTLTLFDITRSTIFVLYLMKNAAQVFETFDV